MGIWMRSGMIKKISLRPWKITFLSRERVREGRVKSRQMLGFFQMLDLCVMTIQTRGDSINLA